MRWPVDAARTVVGLSLACGLIEAAPRRTITLQTLPRLISIHELAPDMTSTSTSNGDGSVGTRDNTTVYIAVPPVSMDQQLYATINLCSLSSSTRYPTILVSNGTSFSTAVDAGDRANLSPWDDAYVSADSRVDRSSGFADKAKANWIREVLRGQYVWDVKLDGNAGFANWTGWMGDGGVIGIFASQGDSIDAEIGLRVGGEQLPCAVRAIRRRLD
jgi:hypothetical protein